VLVAEGDVALNVVVQRRHRRLPRLCPLAIAFCRYMNIPARYLHGPPWRHRRPAVRCPYGLRRLDRVATGTPFNPRNNVPRIGHVLIGRRRDAADVPITLTFGPNTWPASRSGPTRSA